jgi:N-acetylglutamate synthase-like GNAT family acetyltransferase
VSAGAVRDARPADAAAITELLTQLGYPATVEFTAERLADFARDPASRVLVAERDGEVAGVVATHLVPRLDADSRSLRIVDLVVSERHRRAGVGRALVDAAEAEARRLRARRLGLSSGDWREDAHAFYERLGFSSNARSFVKPLR